MIAQVQIEKLEAEQKLLSPAKQEDLVHVRDGENPHWKIVNKAELDFKNA